MLRCSKPIKRQSNRKAQAIPLSEDEDASGHQPEGRRKREASESAVPMRLGGGLWERGRGIENASDWTAAGGGRSQERKQGWVSHGKEELRTQRRAPPTLEAGRDWLRRLRLHNRTASIQ